MERKNSSDSKKGWGNAKDRLISNLRERFEVETSIVEFPSDETFDAPDGLFFMRHDGSPITRSNSVRRPSSSSGGTFQWIPRAVPSTDTILDPKAQRKVERVVARCGLGGKKITPQEAYDALRMANASEDEAVAYINRGNHILSSAEEDLEVKKFLQDSSPSAFTLNERKRQKFT
ncbi:hypothetical protein M434DRAFT_10227 [Hypoxylon sp. CO27-5]|nr:hypothetical protein M434DRAFT_10227 [Hypoxylon sp. CO27-5]